MRLTRVRERVEGERERSGGEERERSEGERKKGKIEGINGNEMKVRLAKKHVLARSLFTMKIYMRTEKDYENSCSNLIK